MALIESIALISVILLILYKWSIRNYDFFEKRKIPFVKPFPLLGNFAGMFLRKECMFDAIKRYHTQFDSPIYGLFEMRNPFIVIKDIELIKKITVKDFDHFMNHRSFIEPQDDPMFGNSLFVMQNQKWKDMRSTLSPVFTGSKMRSMLQLIKECCDEGLKYVKEKSKLNGSKGVELELKDFFTHYTNDVIASTAFGLKINSMTDQENKFYRMGKKVSNFNTWTLIKFSLFSNFKPLMRFFGIKLFDQEFSGYFINLVKDTMQYRTTHNIIRPDMINMLMEAQNSTEKSHNREWTDQEIVAQCFLFFIAGFETTSLLMCFAAHELMENPETQEKLLAEIDEVKEQLDGKPLTYEALQGMKYMDMVTSETLRKWPGAVATDRVCTKPYVLKSDTVNLEIKPGDVINIPIAGLHYDPQYYPNPNKFDPERFSDENKGNIKPFTYAPFGLGPRNCIGSRLALMESKAILYYLLSEFRFEPSKKSTIPLKLVKAGFQLKAEGGFWLKMTPRE